jgi:hypothetical protein
MTLPDTTPDPELPVVDSPLDSATLSDGSLVVYDSRRADAWIRCRAPTDLEGRR